MKFHYFVYEKESGRSRRIDPDKLDTFFTALRGVTGLDRATAEAMLTGGRHIDHPKFTFSAKPVNPFDPVQLV